MTDHSPLENAYYRLKSINQDGAFEVSEIIHIKRNNKDVVSVFPVPVTDVVSVQFHTLVENKVQLILTDMVGRVVRQQEVVTIVGQNTIPLSLTTLDKGVYTLILKDKQQRKTVRIIKQ